MTRYIHFQGFTYTPKEASIKFGINSHTLISRLNVGWRVEKALFHPIKGKNKFCSRGHAYDKFKPNGKQKNGRKWNFCTLCSKIWQRQNYHKRKLKDETTAKEKIRQGCEKLCP